MDTFLVVMLTGLVGYKFVEHRKNNKPTEPPVEDTEQSVPGVMEGVDKVDDSELTEFGNLGLTLDELKKLKENTSLGADDPNSTRAQPRSVQPESNQPETTQPETIQPVQPVSNLIQPSSSSQDRGSVVNFFQKVPPVLKLDPDGVEISTNVTGSHPLNGRSASMMVNDVAETNYRRDPSNDTNQFAEHFFPQDTRNTGFSITKKPWQRAIENAYNVPRSETLADEPTKHDIHKLDIAKTIRNFGELHTERTIPRSSEKQFEYPVEPIQTQNDGGGGLRGHRQLERHHRFLLNNEPALELPEGPRGNFAGGANKSVISSLMDNDRAGLDIDYVGAPVAPSFKMGFPDQTFELEASNAEGYLIDEHTNAAGSRAPVEKGLSLVPPSFSVAHDNKLQTFNKSLNANMSRSSRPKAVSNVTTDKNTSSFKDPTIDTQTVLGAPRGRLSATDKNAEVDNKVKGGLVALGAAKINFNSASKSSGPAKPITKSSIEHADTRLSEEDTSTRVRGADLRKKSVVTPTSMQTNDNRALINTREFTSQNYLAPQDKSLPLHLRNKPTSSMTATRDIALKTETLDDLNTVRGRMVDPTRPGDKLISESTKDEKRLGTILNNRMSSGRALELLQNPYKRPAAKRFKQLQSI